jgi:hypothetical protein
MKIEIGNIYEWSGRGPVGFVWITVIRGQEVQLRLKVGRTKTSPKVSVCGPILRTCLFN